VERLSSPEEDLHGGGLDVWRPLEEALGSIPRLDAEGLEKLRVAALGRKGWLTQALRSLASLSPEARRDMGRRLNEARDRLEAAMRERQHALEEEALARRLQQERVDVSLPAQPITQGRWHPYTRVLRRIVSIFSAMGFGVVEGPEVESERLNFELLNIPPDHPARDMQDSFFPAGMPGYVLRTHTSPVQIRAMQAARGRVPLRILAPGRVFRRDAEDSTHLSVFHQVEGLAVEPGLGLAHLKGVLERFAQAFFGADTRVRLRPSYFPFTEPSVELDVTCVACQGQGCRLCSGTGYLELLGAGMVHPRVLQAGGYNPEEVSGFAFGMGLERAILLSYGLEDVRLLLSGDLEVLERLPAWPSIPWA
jgi:phenylalanyl-tRNA synthetase alpha chain